MKLLGQWNRDCGLDSRGRPAWALCCGPRADSMQAGPRPPRATGLGEGPLRTAATGPLSPGPALAWGGAWQTEGKSQRPQGSPARPLELGLWRQWRKITPCRKAGRTVTARLAAPEHRPPCFVSPRETRSGHAASLSLEGRQRDAPGGGARASEGAPVAQTRPRVPRPQPLLRKQVSGNKLAGLCGATPSSPVGDGGTATRDVTPRACDEDGLHAKREGGA